MGTGGMILFAMFFLLTSCQEENGTNVEEPISAEQPYYYLRITEKDGNRAISAPIWVLYDTEPVVSPVEKTVYNHYRGDLHNHTSFSDGEGTPQTAYQSAIDGGADFLAVSDHVYTLAHTSNDYWTTDEWNQTVAAAKEYTSSTFVALASWETAAYGVGNQHMNVFGGGDDWWILAYAQNLQNLYSLFLDNTDKNFIAQWNHPTETNSYENFAYYSESLDSHINLIEWWNAQDSEYFEDKYQLALDRGWHVAPVANADDHGGRWIKGYTHRTVLLSQELSQDALFEAMRKHRIYATRDKNLKIDYYINNEVMGSTLYNPDVLNFSITVTDPDVTDSIKLIEIVVSNGLVLLSEEFDSNEVLWQPELVLQP
jgi:hypothetical protein